MTNTAFHRAHNMPSEWYSHMMEFKESIEKQMHDVMSSASSDKHQGLTFVQQNMERVNGSMVNYLNDNGKEYLDVELASTSDAASFDALAAINSARQSHGMPLRNSLDGVQVQMHAREKPHYYVRTTRILPNGTWTRYENDNGVELVTEGHIAQKAVTNSALEKNRPDKHPLLNMFRRTFGMSEL